MNKLLPSRIPQVPQGNANTGVCKSSIKRKGEMALGEHTQLPREGSDARTQAQGAQLFQTHKGVKNPDFSHISHLHAHGGTLYHHVGRALGSRGRAGTVACCILPPLGAFLAAEVKPVPHRPTSCGSVPQSRLVFGRRWLGGQQPVRGGAAQGGLKVNGLVEEPVAEENHQGEETELEVAERERSR